MKNEMEEIDKTVDLIKNYKPHIAEYIGSDEIKSDYSVNDKTLELNDLELEQTVQFDQTTMIDRPLVDSDRVDEELTNSLKKRQKLKRLSLKLILVALLFLPCFGLLLIIGSHSNYLINDSAVMIITILTIILTILLAIGIYIWIRDIRIYAPIKVKTVYKYLYTYVMAAYIMICVTITFLLYAVDAFKVWFITTIDETGQSKEVCKWFYSDTEIEEVLKEAKQEKKE